MKICIPYERGAHKRALPLFVSPGLRKRGHEVVEIDGPHIPQQTIGKCVSECDVLLTSSPWWDYIQMWVAAARHFGKPWVYHPEGWDNAHPIITPEDRGHAKNQGWPFVPDITCAHGTAMGRVLTRLRNIPDEKIRYTGGPRFDVYGKYYDDIVSVDPFVRAIPTILVCTSSLWDHTYALERLCENEDWDVIARIHFTDPVEMYDDLENEYGNFVKWIPESVHIDSPERDHDYDPTVNDLIEYARQLYHADVVVNFAGTSTLEALMLGTPVVNLYKMQEEATHKEHQKLFAHYGPGGHFEDVRAGATSYLADHPDQLVDVVNRALQETGWDSHRESEVKTMLRDMLTVSVLPVPHNHKDKIDRKHTWGVPSADATNAVCDAVEEVV
jgi:hypothetical protein